MATTSPEAGGYVHVSQVANQFLNRGHTLYSNLLSESNRFIKLTKGDFFSRGSEIDVFYVRIHGSAWNDELTLYREANLNAPCVWELNAPLEELLRKPGISEKNLSKLNKRRKELAQMVDAAICVSNEMEEYARNKLKIKKTFLVPNGSDPKHFAPDKKSINIYDKSKFIVLWSGSPEYTWQGLEIVQKLSEKLKKIDRDILVAVTAEGKSDENTRYLGRIPYSEIPIYMASANVGLCIYKNIDFYKKFFFSPLKLFDYMASGLSVIGSNVGQIKLVIEENKNGLLTDTSVDDLIEKILYLKANNELASKMGARGREAVVKRYNWGRVVLQIEEILFALLKQPRITEMKRYRHLSNFKSIVIQSIIAKEKYQHLSNFIGRAIRNLKKLISYNIQK